MVSNSSDVSYSRGELSNKGKKEIIKNIFYKSLIGREIKVIESKNESYVGIKGIIVNESKNLFFIKTDKGIKKLLKKDIIFSLNYNYKNFGKTLKINGEYLSTDLITRIKKIKRF